MEFIEVPPVQSTIDNVKGSTFSGGQAEMMAEASFCHTSNGVAESTTSLLEPADADFCIPEQLREQPMESTQGSNEAIPTSQSECILESIPSADGVQVAAPDTSSTAPEEEVITANETRAAVDTLLSDNKTDEISEELIETSIDTSEAILCNEVTIEGSSIDVDCSETSPDKVTLRTEILVEKSEEDVPDSNEMIISHDNANNILSDLSQGIELSEALRSSDTADHGENNNGTMGEEVFNKEELLDILEGNDEPLIEQVEGQIDAAKSKRMIEAQIALKQLSRLQRTPRKTTEGRSSKMSKDETPKKKRGRRRDNKDRENIVPPKEKPENIVPPKDQPPNENDNNAEENEKSTANEKITVVEEKKNDSIVNTLVQDWDDDEPPEADQSNQNIAESEMVLDHPIKTEDQVETNNEASIRTSTDSPSVEGQATNQSKSGDESQLQRGRAGRVIKKKVPFDPDNPDTFTKAKVVAKTKEPQTEKEQPPPKKVKPETTTPQRAKSKSPTGKMQWKKPAAKNSCKQNKRLTEVDKLLMDEGAVNMIYQLTPEAPKGKKNMRTKAEIIKKMQSSTPEGNKDVMKFRERKKEVKVDGEAKKIAGGKSSRSSVSGSVKSASANDDFETHSADDSIIYRRHSSSSYSSACMSPRRLSDLEGTVRAAQPAATPNNTLEESTDNDKSDIFMAEPDNSATEVINKDDCLSIKEKLNEKLSLALKKRKRESTTKTEKPPKQKRAAKNASVEKESVANDNIGKFNHVSVNFDQRLAEICIKQSGSLCSIEMLEELEQALVKVDSRKDVCVTLLTSECGTLCSDLDLAPLLDDKMETRTNYAHAMAEGVRSLLCSVEKHSKLVVSGVWGACSGVALAMVALSDIAIASEHSTFAISTSPPMPGVAALTTRCSRLSHSLINDLLVFGRCVSGVEAHAGGLVSRSVPAARDIARAVASEIAQQPTQSVLLKKQLLNLSKSDESTATFLSALLRERDLLVEYWTSVEGQDAIRALLNQ
ncbi:enoyl-CoA hydratase/isomerase domain-containing protein [Phthorimaea operculella]|nr:enoyl-CoA hydratase/isomerase domain-containing protein [Phthorimaea operculella]